MSSFFIHRRAFMKIACAGAVTIIARKVDGMDTKRSKVEKYLIPKKSLSTKLKDVNTVNIRDAIRLGCQTMCNVFNRDDNDIPFFGSSVWPDACLSFSWAHSEAHVPGRHLNALLNARDALGISIDEEERNTLVQPFTLTVDLCLYH